MCIAINAALQESMSEVNAPRDIYAGIPSCQPEHGGEMLSDGSSVVSDAAPKRFMHSEEVIRCLLKTS